MKRDSDFRIVNAVQNISFVKSPKNMVNETVLENTRSSEWDYIIIGAGIAGAVTLEQLVEKYGTTKTILVLERQNEIGGCLKSYERDYGETSFANHKDRRILEMGGMRYFKDMMVNVENYRKRYGLTSKEIVVTQENNLLLSKGERKLQKDEKYLDRVSNRVTNQLLRELDLGASATLKDVFLDKRLLKKLYNNNLSSQNFASYLVPSTITSQEFDLANQNLGYEGFIDSSIAASVSSWELGELQTQVQDIIIEGFQTMVDRIFTSNGLDTTKNNPGNAIALRTGINVEKVDGNRLITNHGEFHGKNFIWTIPPHFLRKIGEISSMEPQILNELQHGFWDFRATKIFLFYDAPWWDPKLVGRQLLDNPIGQLWIWDDKTLLIYAVDESAMYWQYSLNIDPQASYGKYIDIQPQIEIIPDWYTNRVLPLISEMIPIEKMNPLTGYAVSMWNDNIPFWKRRQHETYGNILERRDRIRFPFPSKKHVYITNATGLQQGWVEGSIAEVLDVFSEFDI
jgi:monoamine oxidase